jgi:hypothetical protein
MLGQQGRRLALAISPGLMSSVYLRGANKGGGIGWGIFGASWLKCQNHANCEHSLINVHEPLCIRSDALSQTFACAKRLEELEERSENHLPLQR